MNQYKASQELVNLEKSLDFYSQQEGSNMLKENISLLAHKGVLAVSGLDFTEISRLYNSKNITISEVNKILSERKSYSSLENRCDELSSYGLIITKKLLNGAEYYVEAVRP